LLLLTVTMARDCPIALHALRRLEKLGGFSFLARGHLRKVVISFFSVNHLCASFGVKATLQMVLGISPGFVLSLIDRPF